MMIRHLNSPIHSIYPTCTGTLQAIVHPLKTTHKNISIHLPQTCPILPSSLFKPEQDPMDWQLAIARNKDALLRIIAALYAFAGLADGAVAGVVARPVYRLILRVLRPAEAAARRLIIIAASGIIVAPRAARPFPGGLSPSQGAERLPAFCLIDPLKRFSPLAASGLATLHPDFDDEAFEDETLDDDAMNGDAWEMDRDDGAQDGIGGLPRISVPGHVDPVFVVSQPPARDDAVSAAHLLRRLAALKVALTNLSGQARRLARWRARRPLVLASRQRHVRLSPVRPGLPPGLPRRGTHEVHAVLRECHGLMRDRELDPARLKLPAPDTS
jgi:hypothetical protein